jgi:hypothetical protein
MLAYCVFEASEFAVGGKKSILAGKPGSTNFACFKSSLASTELPKRL